MTGQARTRTTRTRTGHAAAARALSPRTGTTRTLRRWLVAVVAILCTLGLSACTEIDTILTVDSTGAGTREMRVTLPAKYVSEIVGGPEAARASIETRLPDGLDFTEMSASDDGSLVAVFTLDFSTPEEYQQKVKLLLGLAGINWNQGDALTATDSRFVQGVDIEESFTSKDLLTWMHEGLIADEVVRPNSVSDFRTHIEDKSAKVQADGTEREVAPAVSFHKSVDNGFSSVSMETSLQDELFSRTIVYRLEDKSKYNAYPTLYNDFFAELAEGGFDIDANETESAMAWTVTVAGATTDEIETKTDTALLSDDTVLRVSTAPSQDDPASLTLAVTTYATCEAICSRNSKPMTDTLAVQGSFESDTLSVDENGRVTIPIQGELDETALRRVVPFTDADSKLSLGPGDNITWTGTFSANAEDAALVGDGLAALLEPSSEVGSLETRSDDDGATYIVTISGSGAQDFIAKYAAWAGDTGAYLGLAEAADSGLFRSAYQVVGYLPLPDAVTTHLAEQPVAQTVVLPSGHRFTEDARQEPAGATMTDGVLSFTNAEAVPFTVNASGINVMGYVLLGALVLLVAMAIAAAVIFRSRLAHFAGNVRNGVTSRTEAARAARAAQAAHAAAVPVVPVPAGAPAPGFGPPHAAPPPPPPGPPSATPRADDITDYL